ncbi:ocr-like anti-restriction [Morganella phage phiA020]
MTTFNELYASAKEDLEAAIRELHVTDTDDDEIRDRIYEIANLNVPIYNGDVFGVFVDGSISYEMSDSGLIEGCTDVLHILRVRIFEELVECLYGDLEDCVTAYVEELEDEAETCGYNEEDEE